MSRSKKGAKAPGYEYWSRRPMAGSNPGSWAKQKTHKIERQRNKPNRRDFEPSDGGGLEPLPLVIPEVLRPALAALDEQIDGIQSVYQQAMQQFPELPRRGTPAAELTDREKVAIAIAAGVPTRTYMGDNLRLTVETLQPIGIADRGDGGYIVATLKA